MITNIPIPATRSSALVAIAMMQRKSDQAEGKNFHEKPMIGTYWASMHL